MQHVLELRPPRPKVRALVELALYADFIDFNDALIAVDDADDLTKTLSVLIDIVHRQGRVPRTIEFILGALMHRGASVEISLLKLNLPPALHALLSKGDIIGDITAHCVVKFNNNRGAIAAHRHADLIAPYRPLSSIRQFDRRLLPHVDAQALGSLADRRRLAQRIQQMAIGPQYRERSARILMDVDTMAVDPRRRIVTEDALVTKSEEEEYWSSDESGDETSLPAGPAKPMLPSIRRIDARSSTLLEKRKRRELLAAAFVQNPDPSREQLNELTERIGGTFNANKTWFIRARGRASLPRGCKTQAPSSEGKSADINYSGGMTNEQVAAMVALWYESREPTLEQKKALVARTGVSLDQIRFWYRRALDRGGPAPKAAAIYADAQAAAARADSLQALASLALEQPRVPARTTTTAAATVRLTLPAPILARPTQSIALQAPAIGQPRGALQQQQPLSIGRSPLQSIASPPQLSGPFSESSQVRKRGPSSSSRPGALSTRGGRSW